MALESPGLYTPSLLGTVSFMEGCDGEGRGSIDCQAGAVADRWFHGEQVQIDGSGDVGCGMYARRGQFLKAEAALQPSLCKAAPAPAPAPASSFGISTITARTTVRRPAAK